MNTFLTTDYYYTVSLIFADEHFPSIKIFIFTCVWQFWHQRKMMLHNIIFGIDHNY